MRNSVLKNKLFATTLLASVASGLHAGVAWTQDADEPVIIIEETDEDDVDRQETVVVTGSRIARPEIDTVFPTISTDAELLEKGAFTNVADALNQIPAFGGGTSPLGDQGANIGVNFVDFLDLGSQRTLTLVNGRRFVSQNSAGSGQQVDFSIIPLPLVERIDTIGVGGAPIYGSDAIAGTINVILKDDFEGFEALTQLDRTESGDAEIQTYQIVAGANTMDGRGNVTFSAEYSNSEGLLQSDRPGIYVGEPVFLESGSGRDIDGDGENDSFNELASNRNVQLFTNGGTISPIPPGPIASLPNATFIPSFGIGQIGGAFWQFAPNGDLVPYEAGSPDPESAFFSLGGEPYDYFAQVDQIRSPVERIVFGSTFNYDLFENVRATADVIFANTEGIELVEQGGFQTGVFDGFSDVLTFPVTNPFLNDQARGVLTAAGIDVTDPDTYLSLNRFNNDIIDSSTGSESTTWRIAGGLDGDFALGDRDFRWDVSMNAGQFTNETFGTLINDRRFLLALDARQLTEDDFTALGGPVNNLGASLGDIVCNTTFLYETGSPDERQAILEAQGLSNPAFNLTDTAPVDITACQPLNLFGEGAASPESLEYVVNRSSTNNDIDQTLFTANFGGELFDLPGGTVAFNIGYETRRETAKFQPSGADEVGLGRGAETPRTGGSYSTDEVYGELFIPLISPDMEIPYLYDAQLEGSYRNIENSLAGEAEAWTIGFKVSPIEGLQLRGNATESLRAPSLDELFSPILTSFQFAADPCDFRNIDDRPNFVANCIADGVNVDADGDGVFDFTSNVVNATARGRAGGNPNLANETSEAFTIGVVYEPSFIENLIIKADYIDIRIDDLIQTFNLGTIMTTCYDADPGSFPNAFCGQFTRDATGQIVDFLTGETNADFQENEFLQLDVTYSFDIADAIELVGTGERGDWGNLEIDLTLFQVMNRDSETAGVFNNSGDNGVGGFVDPRTSGLVDFTWDRGPARLFWRVRWQDEALASTTGDDLFVDSNGNRIVETDPYFMNNMSFSYDISSLLDAYDNPLIAQFGVNNVFNQKADDDDIRLALNDFMVQDVLGRTYSLRLRAVF